MYQFVENINETVFLFLKREPSELFLSILFRCSQGEFYME